MWFFESVSIFMYNCLRQTTLFLEYIYCMSFYMYRDLPNDKYTVKEIMSSRSNWLNNIIRSISCMPDVVALIMGNPINDITQRITTELYARNVNVILVSYGNSLYEMVPSQQHGAKSIPYRQISHNINIYKLTEYFKYDNSERKFDIDILILNHIQTNLSKFNSHHFTHGYAAISVDNDDARSIYETSAIIARHIVPSMINQSYGKIIYIDPYEQPSNINTASTIMSQTGFKTTSASTSSELSKHNIIVSHVKGPNNTILTDDDKQFIAFGVGRCLDYGLSTYSLEPMIYNWWVAFSNSFEEYYCLL